MRKLKLLLVLCLVAIAASASKTVYLVPTDKWNYDGARFALHMFTDGVGSDWTDFTDDDGDGIFSATFEDTYASMIICRMNGSTSENNWDNKWTQTSDIPAPVVNGMTYTITSAEGTYSFSGNTVYLYNVGADKYLCSGNNWGSHASVGEGGIPLTLITTSKTTYSISTASIYSGKYLNGEWMDGGSSYDWTFESVGSGIYKIKNGDNVLYLNSGTLVSHGADPGTTASQWKVYTEAERIAAMADATKASPVNATFLIKNYYFAKGNGRIVAKDANLSSSPSWKGTSVTDLWGWDANDVNACYAVEQYGKTFDNYQELSDIPNGKYFMTAKGFYRGAVIPYIYANDEKCNLKLKGELKKNDGTINDGIESGAIALRGDDYLLDGVTVVVTDGNLRVGVKSDASIDWSVFDEFSLQYYGKTISNVAVALPDGGAMAADTWYYFDLPSDSEYDITTTTLDNIVYTKDGTILKEDESTVTANFSGTSQVELTEGRYYIKSSSAQSFEIVAHVKSYSLGSVTDQSIANGDYLGSLTTLVLTYGDAATNDGDAALTVIGSATAKLKKNGVDVATGTLTANDGAKTLTATFSDVTLVANATDYSIVIPAGAFGYEGESVNTEATVTFNTGLIADGVYYFKDNATGYYLTRGGNYGTENIVDKFGISFEAAVQTNGKYTLKNVDQSLVENTNKYLNEQYTDQANAYKWTIETTEGGYLLKRENGSYVTTTEEATWHYHYMTNAADAASAIVWTILTKEQYNAAQTARKNAEAVAIATEAGIDASTESALITALSGANYRADDKSSEIVNASLDTDASGWTAVSYNAQRRNQSADVDVIRFNGGAEVWNYIGGAKQTIADLPEGIYKIEVKSVWRIAGSTEATRAGADANVTAWMYANDNYTQLKSWNDNKPANNAAIHASVNDDYVNTVYVYVGEGEDLTIGIASPSWCGIPWMPFYDWKLTYYKPKKTIAASFVNGKKWANVHAYAWYDDGSEAEEKVAGAWPGTELDTPSGSITYNGEDLDVFTYSFTGFDLPEKIIFNDGTLEGAVEGTNKTANLTFVDGMRDESLVTFIPVYAVVGSNEAETNAAFFDGKWNADTTTDLMTETETNIWTKTFSNVTLTENVVFKVIKKDYQEAPSASAIWYPASNVTISERGKFDILVRFNSSKDDVTYETTKLAEAVAVGPKGWATHKTASHLDFSAVDGINAYTAKLSGTNVTLTDQDNVPSETPIVVKATEGTYYVPVLADAPAAVDNDLQWNPKYEVNDAYRYIFGLYVGGDGKACFKRVNDKQTMGEKAFLEVDPALFATPARELTIVFDDETTGIQNLTPVFTEGDGAVYDLQGRKVAQPTKGLYIVNGKKVVKK